MLWGFSLLTSYSGVRTAEAQLKHVKWVKCLKLHSHYDRCALAALSVPVDVTPFTKACIALLKQKSSSWQKPHHGKHLHHDHAMMAGSGHCEFEDQDDAGSGDADD